jgi:VIT1/CCC1 family predicted Fe2+/Mn2+ transporter
VPAPEAHRSLRIGWLRAAVLGADDGIVSVASILIGVAAANTSAHTVLIAGIAGLVAGALSMAAGEYVSVSSQRDTELADIDLERRELEKAPKAELDELIDIYERRGLDRDLATRVATRLMEVDAVGTHVREELGFTEGGMARPWQAAFASAVSFATGAVIPIIAIAIAPRAWRIPVTAAVGLVLLAALGALGGRVGGASATRAALRVTIGGGVAMALTAGIGRLVGAAGL